MLMLSKMLSLCCTRTTKSINWATGWTYYRPVVLKVGGIAYLGAILRGKGA